MRNETHCCTSKLISDCALTDSESQKGFGHRAAQSALPRTVAETTCVAHQTATAMRTAVAESGTNPFGGT